MSILKRFIFGYLLNFVKYKVILKTKTFCALFCYARLTLYVWDEKNTFLIFCFLCISLYNQVCKPMIQFVTIISQSQITIVSISPNRAALPPPLTQSDECYSVSLRITTVLPHKCVNHVSVYSHHLLLMNWHSVWLQFPGAAGWAPAKQPLESVIADRQLD